MRLLALVALLICNSALAWGWGRGGGLTCPEGFIGGGLTPCSLPPAYFEFAMSSGVGLGTECACTAVTGTKAEAITWTRGSSAYCTAASGTMSLCTSDLPRVMDGGVLLELDGSNGVLRSQEIENAAWSSDISGGKSLTITANQATPPWGGLVAERFQISATEAGVNVADRYQLSVCGTGAIKTASLFVKGTSGSGTFDICINGGTVTCADCNYNPTTWTRCAVSVNVVSNGHYFFGNASFYSLQNRAANDFYGSGAQCEDGSASTSYIATTSALVNRAADTAAVTLGAAVGPNFAMAATLSYPLGAGTSYALNLGTDTTVGAHFGRTSATAALFSIANTATTPAVSSMSTGQHRVTLRDFGGVRVATWDGAVVAAPAASLSTGYTDVLFAGCGVMSAVQIDPSRILQ